MAVVPGVLDLGQEVLARVERAGVAGDRADPRVPLEPLHHLRHRLGVDHAVGVGEDHELAERGGAGTHQRSLLAGRLLVAEQREPLRVLRRQLLQLLVRAVGGAIVDREHLDVRVALLEHRGDATADYVDVVFAGDEAGNERLLERDHLGPALRWVAVEGEGDEHHLGGGEEHEHAVDSEHRVVGEARQPQAEQDGDRSEAEEDETGPQPGLRLWRDQRLLLVLALVLPAVVELLRLRGCLGGSGESGHRCSLLPGRR